MRRLVVEWLAGERWIALPATVRGGRVRPVGGGFERRWICDARVRPLSPTDPRVRVLGAVVGTGRSYGGSGMRFRSRRGNTKVGIPVRTDIDWRNSR